MRPRSRPVAFAWVTCAACASLLPPSSLAKAQIASLGKGWALCSSSATISSAPAEVISGRNSIKGSGDQAGQLVLCSDPLYVPFSANQTYTLTWKYRILAGGAGGFFYGFHSGEGERAGDFGPGGNLQGLSGASGSMTNTWTLGNHADYSITFALGGPGTIVIDDIRVTDAHGTVVASENAEGPTLASGPIDFQLTDAAVVLPDAGGSLRSAAAFDLNGDGYPEIILTFTAPRPSTTPIPPLVIEASTQMRFATHDFFPAGAPTVTHSPTTLFADINNDGLKDLVFADAGSDAPPFEGSVIGVALNLGNGTFRNVQPLVPADTAATRSYAVTAGDIYHDGRVEIVLPDQSRGQNTSLLRWNGSGFDEIRNWIPQALWTFPANLMQQSWMVLADLDRDGKQDLVVGASTGPPNIRIVFGGSDGFTSASAAGNLVTLPDGVFGHQAGVPSAPVVSGADVGPLIVADFNNDGLPDIFAIEQEVLNYQPGAFDDTTYPGYGDLHANGGTYYGNIAFQVFINQGSRRFADVTSASSALKLGPRRYYYAVMPVDVNNDGFIDLVGLYQQPFPGMFDQWWGTTFFFNDGTGAFQVVDGSQLVGATATPSNGQRWNLGSFLPTVVTSQRTEGIAVEMVGGCGGPAYCSSTSGHLAVYKIVAEGSIGTGPNFVDPASRGVPGFNEFYYLRHYPDAAAAVRTGQYPDGLAHFLAVGKAAGYSPHAPLGHKVVEPGPTLHPTHRPK